MMFRCFLRPRGRAYIPPTWLPSLTSSGSRGLRLSKLATLSKTLPTNYVPVAPVVPGKVWLNKLAKNDIGHGGLKKLRAFKCLTVRFAPWHVRKFTDGDYFTDTGHPMAEAIVRRYLRDHKERPLWSITTVISPEKAIVRGKCKYRVHAAFNQALRNAGYDAKGKRIADNKGPARDGAISELFGTVEIGTFEPKEIHNIPFTTLRAFFEEVVGELEPKLGKTADSHQHGHGSETRRIQAQRPQHQARGRTTKRTDVRSPRSREPGSVAARNAAWPGER